MSARVSRQNIWKGADVVPPPLSTLHIFSGLTLHLLNFLLLWIPPICTFHRHMTLLRFAIRCNVRKCNQILATLSYQLSETQQRLSRLGIWSSAPDYEKAFSAATSVHHKRFWSSDTWIGLYTPTQGFGTDPAEICKKLHQGPTWSQISTSSVLKWGQRRARSGPGQGQIRDRGGPDLGQRRVRSGPDQRQRRVSWWAAVALHQGSTMMISH